MSTHYRLDAETGVVEVDTYGTAEGEVFLEVVDTSAGSDNRWATVILTIDEAREVLDHLSEAIKDAQ